MLTSTTVIERGITVRKILLKYYCIMPLIYRDISTTFTAQEYSCQRNMLQF
jgi:hypothetical protein